MDSPKDQSDRSENSYPTHFAKTKTFNQRKNKMFEADWKSNLKAEPSKPGPSHAKVQPISTKPRAAHHHRRGIVNNNAWKYDTMQEPIHNAIAPSKDMMKDVIKDTHTQTKNDKSDIHVHQTTHKVDECNFMKDGHIVGELKKIDMIGNNCYGLAHATCNGQDLIRAIECKPQNGVCPIDLDSSICKIKNIKLP